MKWYVSSSGKRTGDGSKLNPFQRIGQAAEIAGPGDEVIVAPGIYREYVNPKNAGTLEAPIVYRSEEMHKAIITGAEVLNNWKLFEGDVWKVTVPNGIFGDYNPYTTLVAGDWYYPTRPIHTGEIFLNDKSLYEVLTLDEVLEPQIYSGSWDPEGSLFTWYTEQNHEEDATVIYANFRGADPNREKVEFNVRRHCFFPSEYGINYITFSGFQVSKASPQWAPPTAFQEAMIGPNWSKGWIIEDCEISHSKCSGIALGKYLQPNNENKWSTRYTKDGTQTQRDAVCQAQREGWSKEKIGSHIVRRNHIHHCGQTGIVGHLGCIFSLIEDNHIHHINNKQELNGAEIGGIKLHAAIDVILRRNHIHHCTRGLWLDWQAQGTRVTQNLFHDNSPPEGTEIASVLSLGEDIWVEVSHGPTLLDNNILLSDIALKLNTQGVAIVHNLIAGATTGVGEGVDNGGSVFATPRYTPYHVPHGTEIDGFMTIQHGDMRFYNNIFVQQKIREDLIKYKEESGSTVYLKAGTKPYDGYPDAETYFARFKFENHWIRAEKDKYYDKMPVYSGGNVFFNGAKPYDGEVSYTLVEEKIELDLHEVDGRYRLSTNLFEYLPKNVNEVISTQTLGQAFEPEQCFENPDGSEIIFDSDYFGEHRGVFPISGPFEEEALDRPLV